MKQPEPMEFWRAGLGRDLTPAEEARLREWMARAPGKARSLEEELELNQLLRALPDVPVSSNFSARVLASVQLEESQARRPVLLAPWRQWLAGSWGRRLAFASLALSVGWMSVQQYQAAQRKELARSVAQFSAVAMPTLEVIRDFPAIEGLRQVSLTSFHPETDLLDALQP